MKKGAMMSNNKIMKNLISITFCVFGFFICNLAVGLDLDKYERQCIDLGFSKNSESFGECVLELHSRDRAQLKSDKSVDHSLDHKACHKYGFEVGTRDYSQCRMQIDLVRKQLMYEKSRADELVVVEQKRREREKGEFALLMGLRMMSDQSRFNDQWKSNFHSIQPINKIINLPNGKFISCSNIGFIINCQ